MRKKNIIMAVATAIAIGTFANASAQNNIDFAKKESYYQELCNKRSSYEANLQTCKAYESYLNNVSKQSQNNVTSIQKEIQGTKDDITKLVDVIKKNEELIKTTKTNIEKTKSEIKVVEKEIKRLEAEIKERLELVQEVNSENFVIDFLMSSVSLDDFFTKMDGINAINDANSDLTRDLKSQRKKLDQKNKDLKEKEESLKEANKQQEELLKEFRSKESDLYASIEANRQKNTAYQNKAKNLNINDIKEEEMDNEVEEEKTPTKPNKPNKPNKPSNKPNSGSGSSSSGSGSSSSGSSSSGSGSSGGTSGGGSSSSSAFIKPVSHATVTATSWYYPASFGGGWHPGIDLAHSQGTKIKAPGKGVILFAGGDSYSGYGNHIVSAHKKGKDVYVFLYGHMTSFRRTGGNIAKGETIGYMGSTGFSTGPHLHFEIIKLKNRSLKSVVKKFNATGDYYFGLGYNSVGSCSSVCRMKPHSYFGLSYGQSF